MTDLMTRLHHADPVADPPDAPPVELLLGRLEEPTASPRRARPRRRLLAPALGLATVLVALAVGLAVIPNGTSPDVVAEAQEALGPAGGVVHYVLRQPDAAFPDRSAEMWVARDPLRLRTEVRFDGKTMRFDYADGVQRAILPGADRVTVSRMAPDFRAQYEADEPSPTGIGGDPLAGIRAMLDAGALREDGETEIDGRRVRRLVGTEPAREVNGTTKPEVRREYYVDAETFAPVRLVEHWADRGASTTDVELYERLPSTPENTALLRLPGIEGMKTVEP